MIGIRSVLYKTALLGAILILMVAAVNVVMAQSDEVPMDETEAEVETETETEASDETVDGEMHEDYSGQSCGDCHLDYHASWATGVHAIAFERESFQAAWEATDNDDTCLGCHTTDFQPAVGQFIPNIQCEACHGPNPADHPPQPIVIDRSAEVCGDCHTSTFDEWERSLHAFNPDLGAVGCATCHNPHGQNLRFEEIDAVCLNCHQNNEEVSLDYAESFVHVSHNEVVYESVDVTCASCHMYSVSVDPIHDIADHSMHVTTRPCNDCHEEIAATGESLVLVDVDTALAEQRDELQAEVASLQEELALVEEETAEGGLDVVALTQGLIIGIGIGITVLWVLMGRSNRRRSTKSN